MQWFAEAKNLAVEKPEIVKELTELMRKFVDDGRSTPGAKQANDSATSIDPRG